ncbi:hypothetical protein SKDZ_04G4290 [Saccharomyces kudriavzevii ZP591]|nr:hypothetical protein SKDZ_04G4290 [Saccharomyces kudriavzevii ZP591]
MVGSVPVRRRPYLSSKIVQRKTSAAASFPSTSSTIFYSSNNDDGFDLPSDSSLSGISDVESSITSVKRLILKNISRDKNQSHKFSREGRANVLEGEVSLDNGPRTEADNISNYLLASNDRSKYVSNRPDVSFDVNFAEKLTDLPIGKNESYEGHYSDSPSKISPNEEDLGVEIIRDDSLNGCQAVSRNDDELITTQYPETESEMEFDEVALFTSIEGMNKGRKEPELFEKRLDSNNLGGDTFSTSGDNPAGESSQFSLLSMSNISSFNESLFKIRKCDEFHTSADESFNLKNAVIDAKRRYVDYLYISSREESSDSSFSSEDSRNYSLDDHHNVEEIIYRDDDSTDEDGSLPLPDPKRKKIGFKACEIVDARKIGIQVPKLCIWSLSDKPFSVIDGLSTKSLYQLGDEAVICGSSSSSSNSSPMNSRERQKDNQIFDNDTMLTDLLNISGSEIEKASNTYNESIREPLFEIPKRPLSSSRGRRNCSKETDTAYDRNAACDVSKHLSGVFHDEIERNARVRRGRLQLKREL